MASAVKVYKRSNRTPTKLHVSALGRLWMYPEQHVATKSLMELATPSDLNDRGDITKVCEESKGNDGRLSRFSRQLLWQNSG